MFNGEEIFQNWIIHTWKERLRAAWFCISGKAISVTILIPHNKFYKINPTPGKGENIWDVMPESKELLIGGCYDN